MNKTTANLTYLLRVTVEHEKGISEEEMKDLLLDEARIDLNLGLFDVEIEIGKQLEQG